LIASKYPPHYHHLPKKPFQYQPKTNLSPLFIGGVPWLSSSCSFYFFLDQFQYYSVELKAFYLQA
jgi:hypothetical protein